MWWNIFERGATSTSTASSSPTIGYGPAETIYPTCARACVAPAISAISCTTDSATCQCSPSDATAFKNAVNPCVAAACSISDQDFAFFAYAELCITWSLSIYTTSLSAYSFSFNTGGLSTYPASYSTASDGASLTTQKTISTIVGNAGSMATQTEAGAGQSTSSSSSPNTDVFQQSASSALSSGAKAGIGVGVVIGGLLVIGLIVLAFVYGRRSGKSNFNTHESAPTPGPEFRGEGAKAKLGGNPTPNSGFGVVELKGSIMQLSTKPSDNDEKRELERRQRDQEVEVRRTVPAVLPIATERHEEVETLERHELHA